MLFACLGLAAKDPGPSAGTLLELQPLTSASVKDLKANYQEVMARDIGSRLADFQAFGVQQVFLQMIQAHLAGMVPSQGLKYASFDSHGHARVYSGRVFLPSRKAGAPPARVPLVIYSHGTEVRKKAVPYYNQGEETMLGALGAEMYGMAVAMPDEPGMGADPSSERHPYLHAQSLANCIIDFVRALQGQTGGKRVFDGVNYVWNGDLYIVGYSEGGYITMAALKELTENPELKSLNLKGAACMAGPFDLSPSALEMLGDDRNLYSRPYIQAYLLAGWEDVYPKDFSMAETVNPKLLGSQPSVPGGPDQGSLVDWMNGRLGGDQVTRLIQARLTGKPTQMITASSMVNPQWAARNLNVSGTQVMKLLKENTLVGGWAPKVPVLLAHDPYDECVPFRNSQAAYDSWKARNGKPYPIVRLESRGKGPGHVGGAVISVPLAFAWIAMGMPPAPMKMDPAALLQNLKGGGMDVPSVPGGMPKF